MEGVFETCQTYFEQYVEAYGQPPGRDFMMRAPELATCTESQIRRAWEILMGRPGAPRPYNHREVAVATVPSHDEQDGREEQATVEEQLQALAVALPSEQQTYAPIPSSPQVYLMVHLSL